MRELETILLEQARRYPLMEPTDAVKLIYQNEFGGGHLIRDEDACLAYLRAEYAAVEKPPAAARSEYIGNGITRVHLAALAENELDALGRAFIASAAAHTGSMERFLEKLEVLRHMAREGVFVFSSAELEAYLTAYAQKGFPPVSHSPAYREHYRPAYRVVRYM